MSPPNGPSARKETPQPRRVFLLSPARIGGPRSRMLLRHGANFDLALRLRAGTATVAEVYSFVSELYFRGKVAYVEAFSSSPEGVPPAVVIVPGVGLIPLSTSLNADQLQQIGTVDVDEDNAAYSEPLLRDAVLLNEHAGENCEYVLLGSVATAKYTRPLLTVFGPRLLFPSEFVGRGDMSRGGLMLRSARARNELSYVPVQGATLHGERPPKLEPVKPWKR